MLSTASRAYERVTVRGVFVNNEMLPHDGAVVAGFSHAV